MAGRHRPRLRAAAGRLLAMIAWIAMSATIAATPALAGEARTIGSIRFEPCELPVPNGGPGIEAGCAHYEVAENPAAPHGRRIRLNLALVAARAARPQPDLVVMLAGGPGQSATESYALAQNGFQVLLKDRSVLLVDQRGTGGSNALKCPPVDYSKASEQTPAAARLQAEACLASLKDRADPRYYTTSDAIRDLETLRHALGDPLYDLVGASYGTRVALSYLQVHPDSLRSVILDGVVPQDVALGQDHARNLEDGLAKIFAACRADAACAKRFGDPAKTLAELRARLRRAPQTVELRDPLSNRPRSETLNELYLAGIVRLLAYQPEAAALLPLLLDEALQGRPQALVAQGLIVFGDLQEQLAHGMELSVICSEDAPELRPRSADENSLVGNLIVESFAAQCAVWPKAERPAGFKQPVVSDKPVLLLSGEWDPVTPPRFAEAAAKGLRNSRQLVARGRGHTVLWRGCLPKLAAKFVETLDPVNLDAGCLASFGLTPAFTSYLGPAP